MMPMRQRTVAGIVATLISSATLVAQGATSPLPPPPPRGLPELQPGPVHYFEPEELQRDLGGRAIRFRAQPSSGAPQQAEEFKPLSELPPEEKLPAAPMLVAAYIVVLLAFFAYVLSLARRMRSVTQEIDRLETELKRHPQR